jgi:hypothetical protein
MHGFQNHADQTIIKSAFPQQFNEQHIFGGTMAMCLIKFRDSFDRYRR